MPQNQDPFLASFGFTEAALSELSGVQRRTLRGYVDGKQPRADVVQRLAMSTGHSVAEVYRNFAQLTKGGTSE